MNRPACSIRRPPDEPVLAKFCDFQTNTVRVSLGKRLAGMRDAPASRSAGILPALANEVGKAATLAAILSHPIGSWVAAVGSPHEHFASRRDSKVATLYASEARRIGWHIGKPGITIVKWG